MVKPVLIVIQHLIRDVSNDCVLDLREDIGENGENLSHLIAIAQYLSDQVQK